MTRIKVLMQVELDDGTERMLSLYVAPGMRVSDTLNDARLFLAFETADGETEIIRKDAIRRVVPMENATKVGRGPYEILGISENASDAEVRAAYHKAIGPVHPDNVHPLNLPPDFLGLANRMAARVNEAYAKIKRLRGRFDGD